MTSKYVTIKKEKRASSLGTETLDTDRIQKCGQPFAGSFVDRLKHEQRDSQLIDWT